MYSQNNRNRVGSPQIIREEVLKENDCSRHNSISVSLHRGCAFCIRPISKYITYTFFRIFPPARFLSNALIGLDKLQALDEKVVDEKGEEMKDRKAAAVRRGDKGFNELMKVIMDNNKVEGEFENIILWEGKAGVRVGNISPEVVRFLVLEQGEKEELIRTDPFDPSKPIRDLRNWVEDNFRKQLAYWTIGMLGVWLLANSIMLYLLNK